LIHEKIAGHVLKYGQLHTLTIVLTCLVRL